MTFTFRLEHEEGTPADPATLEAAVPNWRAGELAPPASFSHQVSIGTAASQKSSFRPVDSLTTRNSRNSSSDGSVGVPP
jgi:hypothetical protein